MANQIVTETDILSDVLGVALGAEGGTGEATFSDELARYIVDLGFGERAVLRMRELAKKNREGVLSAEERLEMERYMRVGSFLNLLQSRARAQLRDEPGEPR